MVSCPISPGWGDPAALEDQGVDEGRFGPRLEWSQAAIPPGTGWTWLQGHLLATHFKSDELNPHFSKFIAAGFASVMVSCWCNASALMKICFS